MAKVLRYEPMRKTGPKRRCILYHIHMQNTRSCAPFSKKTKAQGPFNLGRKCHRSPTCACESGPWNLVSHPSGGHSDSPNVGSRMRAYVASLMTFRNKVPFPRRLVKGSAIITDPGTQNVVNCKALADTQITATSI